MAKMMKAKRKGFELAMKTFKGQSGRTYLVFRKPGGQFHTFVEVEAKEAALDCESGSERYVHTQYHWRQLWNSQD